MNADAGRVEDAPETIETLDAAVAAARTAYEAAARVLHAAVLALDVCDQTIEDVFRVARTANAAWVAYLVCQERAWAARKAALLGRWPVQEGVG